ncbi:glycosyltransferase [Glutamicibacter protophormiae]|nr:glycosyltransferase [Glutamicibacter protophormiae]
MVKPLTIDVASQSTWIAGANTIRGTGEPEAKVVVSIGTRDYSPRTVAADGSWEIRINMSPGKRKVSCRYQDELLQESGGVSGVATFLATAELMERVANEATAGESSAAEIPVLTHIRMGIGVTDADWWEFRLGLFESLTLPSLARSTYGPHLVVLVLDSQVDLAVLDEISRIVRTSSAAPKIRMLFVESIDSYAEYVHRFARAAFGDQIIGIHRMDDDDALAAGFLSACVERHLALGHEGERAITMGHGFEYNPALALLRPAYMPWLAINHVVFGRPHRISELRLVSHHKTRDWATSQGMDIVEDESLLGAYAYVHHRQSDSAYPARLERMRMAGDTLKVSEFPMSGLFGSDAENLRAWREQEPRWPVSLGKTWLSARDLDSAVVAAWSDWRAVKRERDSRTAQVVVAVPPGPAPAPHLLSVEERDGIVLVTGVGEPGSYIRVMCDGQQIRSAPVPSAGEWTVSVPSPWSTERISIMSVTASLQVSDEVELPRPAG